MKQKYMYTSVQALFTFLPQNKQCLLLMFRLRWLMYCSQTGLIILLNRGHLIQKSVITASIIYGILNEKTIHHQPKTIMSRNSKSITFEPIAEELANAPWQVGEIFNDIDDRVDYWNGLITYMVDAHAPLRKKRVREIDVPYMTLEWKNAIRRKRKYAQLYAKTKPLKITSSRKSTEI